jgi:hypothetical protein
VERFKIAKKHYDYLLEKYGMFNDFTGSSAESDDFASLLMNPSKKNAAEIMEEYIRLIIQGPLESGGSVDRHDPRVIQIKELYFLD